MNVDFIINLAQSATQRPGGGGGMMFVTWMLIVFALFYVMAIRPQRRKEKDRKEMIANTKIGDKVIFSGGIIGIVTNVKEYTLVVKVSDKVKLEILRGAVVKKVVDKVNSLKEET